MPKDKDLQYIIGNLLRAGVWFAITIVFIGLCIYLFQQKQSFIHYSTFKPSSAFNIPQWWHNLLILNSEAIIQLGIISLIALPVLRVLFTLVGFALEKDFLYVIIAFIVLCIIATSLFISSSNS